MTSFLQEISVSRRAAVDRAKGTSVSLEGAPALRDFAAALREPGMSLVAEVKRASPSRGDLNADLVPAELARSYEKGGARAVSVLAEPQFFKGSPTDVRDAKSATGLPVLWKDFVLDPYQIELARASGADAVLLIVRMLPGEELRQLMDATTGLGMCPLVEVFDESDLDRALEAGAEVVGVNHRDLETFSEDPRATARLRPLIPEGVAVVAESAISTRTDVEALEGAGVDAVLVGEALVTAADPAAKITELLGR